MEPLAWAVTFLQTINVQPVSDLFSFYKILMRRPRLLRLEGAYPDLGWVSRKTVARISMILSSAPQVAIALLLLFRQFGPA